MYTCNKVKVWTMCSQQQVCRCVAHFNLCLWIAWFMKVVYQDCQGRFILYLNNLMSL